MSVSPQPQAVTRSQVYELELPMMGAPQEFFEAFYADNAEWAALQHRVRGDKSASLEIRAWQWLATGLGLLSRTYV